jgi:hypothetical protein
MAGKVGSEPGKESFESIYDRVSKANTFEPRTLAGQQSMKTVNDVMEKLPPVLPEIPKIPMPSTRPFPISGATRELREATAGLRDSIRKPAEMAGGGAAMTAMETQRRQLAAGLDVPIELPKSKATGDFTQHALESDLSKTRAGKPLLEAQSETNKRILQNFDKWVDDVGAVEPDLRATGKNVVEKALMPRVTAAKKAINDAYEQAKADGSMEEPVAAKPLIDYLKEHEPEAINAPILTSVRQKILQLTDNGKKPLSINASEEIRKMINRVSQPGTPNVVHGIEMKKIIDQMTDGKGGEGYVIARKMRSDFAREFEDHAIVDNLLSTKRGTKDRVVAFEDVFHKTILDGSHDDISVLHKVLENSGEAGAQAWKELQGQTIQHLRDSTIKGVNFDINGRPVPSPAGLIKTIKSLDRDGKLDLIFGKQQAQKIRDLGDAVVVAYTSPEGSINRSNNRYVMVEISKKLENMAKRLPGPVAWAAEKAAQGAQSISARNQVKEALRQPNAAPAGAPQIPPVP